MYSKSNTLFSYSWEEVFNMFSNDKLFLKIKEDKHLFKSFQNDKIIQKLEKKSIYSTPQIAEMFGIDGGQIRYYLKAFESYISYLNVSEKGLIYRLNCESVIKLKMIFLLKDSQKVVGIKKLLMEAGTVEVNPKTDECIDLRNDQINNSTLHLHNELKLNQEITRLKLKVQSLELDNSELRDELKKMKNKCKEHIKKMLEVIT